MKIIPPTITDLASSKKAVTFWVLIGLWLPVTRKLTGLVPEDLMWLSIAYIGYALGQGMKDLGREMGNRDSISKP